MVFTHTGSNMLFNKRDLMTRFLCSKTFQQSHGCGRGLSFLFLLIGVCIFPITLSATITFVQGNSATPQSPQTTVNVTFSGAQTAGNLNVVVVGWNDSTAAVATVKDQTGNAYTLAVGPTIQSGVATQSIYYAKNIAAAAAGANTVTVTFSTAAAYPDIRILEYAGADPVNPVDVFSGSTGNSSTSSSGAATTTNPTDLLFGANLVQTVTTGPGTSFTKRLLTQPDGDIAEDRSVTSTGSYSATAPISSGQWIMQMVAFRAFVGTSPTITSVSPNSGSTAGGTSVTITGTNFATGAAVTFGSAVATNVVVVNSTTITATTPAGSSGAVTVTVTLNGQSGALANGFTYVSPPTVTSVTPNTGTTAGGTSVTITGTNFATGATVTFGSAAATNVTVVNGTTVTATTPAGSVGAVAVTVTVKGVSGSLANAFTYAVLPTVTSVSPSTGTTAGGTSVTIAGTNFAAGATVTFGTNAATNVVVVSSTSIMATTPAGSAGVVGVTVMVNGQSGTLANGFTYVAPPTVTGVNPNSGSTAGGTSVTITGTNFAAGATVTFGSAAATNVTVVNGTTITATTPAGSAGAVTVTVTNPGSQSGSLNNAFTYIVLPTISGVSPNTGSTSGGTSVTISGSNFAAGASVTFGANPATNVVVVSSTSITATTPAASPGAVTVAVTVNGQSGSLANGFTYVAPPTVTSTNPNSGSTAGGTSVTITGTNFAAGATVMFGSAAATNVTVLNSTTITAVTPAGSAGAVAVSVTVSGLSGSLVNGFTYAVIPTVTSVSPNNGPTVGGTSVTITGTNFAAGATVTFANNAATNVVVVSSTSITATTPAGAAGAVTVTITVNGQSGSLSNGFTYVGAPTVTGVNPNSGTTAGGTSVTISGTNFAAGATVAFGSAAAINVTVVNSTSITATTPSETAGAVTVTVTNPGPQSGSLTNAYTYVTPSTPTAPGSLVAGGGPAPMVAAVQSYLNSTALTSHTTAGFNSTGANLIVLLASSHAGVTFTPSDSLGNTWIPIAGPSSTTVGSDLRTVMWYARNPNAGPGQTVTVALSAAQPLAMSIFVVTGANASSPVEAISLIGNDNGTQTTSVTSPMITTTSANDLLLGFVNVSAAANFISGAGFTPQTAASSNLLDAESGVAVMPGNYAATFTISPGQTWQSTLVAASPDITQSTLSWSPSTESGGTISLYLVERCQGNGCGSFSQIGTTAGTTFKDAGLTPSTTYTYRVRAEDTANNLGPYSNVVSFTTPPTIPAAPGNVTAIAASSEAMDLSWVASTENGGTVAGYSVERCQDVGCTSFAQVGNAIGNTFNDTGLVRGTTYTYRVRAIDTNGNFSPYSNLSIATTQAQSGSITYVQGNYATPQSSQTTVSVPFKSAQGAGDLNVVVVGWNDSTSTVASVKDTSGNVYARAVGPTVQSPVASQSIYYAKNIAAAAAGANSVAVTFSTAAAFPDIRVLEYAGADQANPVDVTAASTGNSTSSNSGAVTTSNASDLLFGANLVQTTTTGAGSGFTSRLLTAPDEDIAEDRMVSATGSYSATAPLTSGQWIMQMVAFRAAALGSVAPPTTPTNLVATAVSANQINLSWTASTSSIGISNYIVQRCQGSACTNFMQLAAPVGLVYIDTTVFQNTTYSYQVQAVDTIGNVSGFSNVAAATTPVITGPNPIVIENQQQGSANWQLGATYGRPYADDGNQQIKGYASATSINKGESISFMVTVNPAQSYTIDVYRIGWYQALGGRLMQHIGPLNGTTQPACPVDATTGLTECHWTPAYTLTVPTSWTTGIYLAVLGNAQGYYNYILFCVRDDSRSATLYFQSPVMTSQAYNNYPATQPGKSLYDFNSGGANTLLTNSPRAVKVSFDRPYAKEGAGNFIWLGEINLLRWLEMSGYDVGYFTDVDTHINPNRLLNSRIFLSSGHDEYWSKPMYDGAIAALNAGVNLGIFGANTIFWQVRMESSSSGVPNRVLVCYKDATIDPTTDPKLVTVEWRDPLLNRAEQGLMGVEFTDGPKNGYAAYVVTNSSNWVYAGTGFKDGDSVAGIVGYEADRQVAGAPLPNAMNGTYVLLSHSPYTGSNGSDYSNSSIYQAATSGAWVFASGTHAWPWSLDNFYPEGTVSTVDPRMQQTMTNILNKFLGH